MNKTTLFFTTICALPLLLFSQEVEFSPKDWQDPSVFEKGQTAPHAFHIPFNSETAALSNDPSKSENYQLLNGLWDFKWVSKVEEVPEGFWQPKFKTKEWDKIQVPSNWQMEGYGHPKFRNISLSFESDPPNIPDYYNPVGCYRRDITIPSSWDGKQIKLRFEGVKSATYVWINGKRVGYNQGGFEPAEFDITPFVTTGKNTLAVQVIRFSDGSYLENQDMWRLSGIFRDVKLYAQPKTMIQDHYVVTDLDTTYEDATFTLSAIIGNTDNSEKSVQLQFDILDNNNSSIIGHKTDSGKLDIPSLSSQKVDVAVQVIKPQKWSAEFPNRYTLLVVLTDNNGQTIESFTQKIGFREVEYNNRILTVNGVPIKLNGINSHMHHPEKGQAVPLATLRKDLEIMKQFNMNCVRTCHYPPTSEYLDLADELGIYVVDEVGDEAHANIQLSEDPAWTAMYEDRSRKMVYRDRNHPSIIIWSAGNESGSGENIKAVIETGKEIDPSRPAWMYGGNTFYIPFEDIVGPRYYIPLWLRNIVQGDMLPEGDNRSSFMDEYLAATGNSLGGLDEYWEIIRRSPRSMGGAIWDFVSPGIITKRWVVHDLSPKKNDGQIMGRPTFEAGISGRGLKFTGHDDWVEFYRDPSLNITGNAIAIGFWVKPTEIPQPNVFLSKGIEQYGLHMKDSDTLEFYVNTKANHSMQFANKRVSAKAIVGPDFYGNWHHIAGIYDGQNLKLYLDDKVVAETHFTGNITTTAFPLCLGREAEKQDQGEYSGRMSSMVLDEVRIFDHAVSLLELKTQVQDAVLALDFETDTKGEDFYAIGLGGRTYGVIWPDRKIQPEIHQIKKSGQPLGFELIDAEKLIVNITNYHHFKDLNTFTGYWSIMEDGKEIEKGTLALNLPAQKSKKVTIPFTKNNAEGEVILTVGFSLKEKVSWATEGYEIAWEQFILKKADAKGENYAGEALSVYESPADYKISGKDFTYVFDKKAGKWTSMIYQGTEYLLGGPDFQVWRAPLANDVDPWGSYMYYSNKKTPGYGRSIDNQLRTLGLRNLHNIVDDISITTAKNKVKLKMKVWSASSLNPKLTQNYGGDFSAFERDEVWTIHPDGTLELDQEITPNGAMPEILPKEGLQFQLPKSFNQVAWYGRGPFETYPDRKTGAKVGIYESTDDAMFEPYIIPQDYGNRTDVRWMKIENGNGKGLLISSDKPLNFSVHKYTTDNLSRAVYTYQLKEAPYTILNIDYNVSGVGGTALRQLETYREKAAHGNYKLKIKPY